MARRSVDSRLKTFPPVLQAEARLGQFAGARLAFGVGHRLRRSYYRLLQAWRTRRDPLSLGSYEQAVSSQNGEDGILREIFRRIGVTHGTFVEFGCSDGSECCTRRLLVEAGWRGLWIEGSPESAACARQSHSGYPIEVEEAFVTRENICDLLRAHAVPERLDLLVVDIDGNDYWVLESILEQYHPAVIVCEYNARLGPATRWVMPYDAEHVWDHTCYHGASLTSLVELAAGRGYDVVACDSMGVNVFLVDRAQAGAHFTTGKSPGYYYCAPRFGSRLDFGHPLPASDSAPC